MRLRERVARRLWASDGDPGPTAWAIAIISLILPVVGGGLCLIGAARAIGGQGEGWTMIGLGAAMLVADIAIDFIWAHPGVSISDQPDLNRRGHQLVGRVAVVTEALAGGRGRVRVGDSLWAAEGPDLPAGAAARIVAVDATVLRVAPIAEES